jgi:ADP-dependent NAD(P)H-hydrate dehydratase / NAD(P)H-hydrate epimerase
MFTTITPEDMRRVERRFMAETGTPSLTLMERAAARVADAALPYLQNGGKLLAACGAGNNGGDGLAAARILMERLPDLQTTVWRLPGEPSAEAAAQGEKLTAFMDRVETVTLENDAPELPAGTACALDALFGTGLNRPLAGAARAVAERLNTSGMPVVAVDIPSGLNGLTGSLSAENGDAAAVHAAVTVTFHRPKLGLCLGDGPDCCGRVIVGDIGIPRERDNAEGMAVLEAGDPLLPPRKRNTHKGTYGRLLVLAGSFGMAGAAAVCATAALRTGAGLVTVACPREIVPTVQALCPCATCLPLDETDVDAAWDALLPALERTDALAAGCGLGREALAVGLTKRLFPWLTEHRLPAVLDADALNLLAMLKSSLSSKEGFPDTVVLTPHPGEAARMLAIPAERITADPVAAARALRARYGGAVVLKGAASVLIAADGEALNLLGTPAMAKGGSGDALTGVLGALLAGREAYGLSGVRLLQAACALHGLAGVAAAERCGERGMLATDLCEAIGRVGPD